MKNNRVREIYKVFDGKSDFLAKSTVEVSQNRLNKLLENLYSPGLSFQYIFDFPNRKFEFVSDGVFTLFGEDPSTFQVEDFVNRIHPEDIQHFARCEEIAGHFLFSFISKIEIPHYKISYQLRIKDRHGEYKLFLHQAIALAVDEEYNISSTFANHSDISHITTTNNCKVSFINVLGGKSYLGISDVNDLDNNQPKQIITSREIEILKLASEGFTSKEIADYLLISLDTVRTHRKNILSKTDFKNLTQAVTYFVREGLI